jgi:hypothetical protein
MKTFNIEQAKASLDSHLLTICFPCLLLSKRQRRQVMDLALSLSRDNHEKASKLRQVRKQRILSQLNIEYGEELQAMRENQGFAKAE